MAINFPEGTQDFPSKICDMKFAEFSGTQSSYIHTSGNTDTAWDNITNLVISHACKSTSNRVLLQYQIGATADSNNNDSGNNFRFYNNTDSHHIGVGENSGNRLRCTTSNNYAGSWTWEYWTFVHYGSYIWHPNSTSTKQYTVQFNPGDATSTSNGTHINRPHNRANNDASGGSHRWLSNTISTFTLFEIAGSV